jgi:hypothetical protein
VVEIQLHSIDFSTGVPGNASIAYVSYISLSLLYSDTSSSIASAIATNLQFINLSVRVYSFHLLAASAFWLDLTK